MPRVVNAKKQRRGRSRRLALIRPPERKFVQASQSSAGMGTAGSFFNLAVLGTGTGQSERVGTHIFLNWLHLRVITSYNNSSTLIYQAVRFVVFYDTMPNGSNPSFSDILTNTIGTIYDLPTYNNFYGPAKRFTLLLDKTHLMAGQDSDNAVIITDIKIPIRKEVHFISTGTTIANVQRGNLGLMAISNDNANPPLFAYQSHVEFVDQ